jgi:hypothetical protein
VHLTNKGGCDSAATLLLTIDTLKATFLPVTSTKACYGSFVYAVAKGNGVKPYSFSLNGGTAVTLPSYHIYNLLPGTYTETVIDSLGCAANAGTLTIMQPAAPLKATASSGTINCTGSSATITASASGGWGGYMYNLNGGTPQAGNSFTVNPAGTYIVQVTDSAGCTASQTLTTGALTATLTAAKNQACYNATVNISAKAALGTAPYMYSLNGGAYQATPQWVVNAGGYAVSVKDAGGCVANTNLVTITQPSAPLTLGIKQTNVTCYGAADGAITATAAGGYGSYLYKLNANPYQSSGVFSGLAVGADFVSAEDAAGCTAAVVKVIITQPYTKCPPAPVTKLIPTLQLAVKAYPNPGTAAFTLVLEGGDSKYKAAITVRDMYGHAVYQTAGSVFDTYRFGNSFAGGVYLVEVRNGNMVQTLKLVKAK